MLILNIFKFVAFKRRALTLIGRLSKRFAHFVKQDIAMFEILEKEKRSNYVGNDQEYYEFLQECANSNQDFSIELYIRVRYLLRFLNQCAQVRIKDLYVIFDNQTATQATAQSLSQNMPQCKTLQRLRKLEFTHSPALRESEFFIVK